MTDAMVTGRMSSAKKEAGNRVLNKLGLNASQAINQMYDYLIEEHALPFAKQERLTSDKKRVAEARDFVRSIPRKNCFSNMTDEQIKQTKLSHYGLNIKQGTD